MDTVTGLPSVVVQSNFPHPMEPILDVSHQCCDSDLPALLPLVLSGAAGISRSDGMKAPSIAQVADNDDGTDNAPEDDEEETS